MPMASSGLAQELTDSGIQHLSIPIAEIVMLRLRRRCRLPLHQLDLRLASPRPGLAAIDMELVTRSDAADVTVAAEVTQH